LVAPVRPDQQLALIVLRKDSDPGFLEEGFQYRRCLFKAEKGLN